MSFSSNTVTARQASIGAGMAYWGIFFLAIFANFFVLEPLRNKPEMAWTHPFQLRLGGVAFLVAALLDVVVAWCFYRIYTNVNTFILNLSIVFRVMHATLMGAAVFVFYLLPHVERGDENSILQYIDVFDGLWLIGLFFFGIHLLLLGYVIHKPRIIAFLLILAGIAYSTDTVAHMLLANYQYYAIFFLLVVAITGISGEMLLATYLIIKGMKEGSEKNK